MSIPLDDTNHEIWPDDLTPDETSQVYQVAAMPQQHRDHKRTLLKASAAIGAAFLVYQAYMERRLKNQLEGKENLPPERYAAVANQAFATFMPAWVYMVAPAIFSSYLSGVELSGQLVATQELQGLAENYSYHLGEYVHQKSVEAAISGYQAQLNVGLGSKIALSNIIHAFALPIRAIKALIAMWTGREVFRYTDKKMPSLKKTKIDKSIRSQLRQRAKTIGDHESFGAQATGQQLAWLTAQQAGLIPQNATREWVTAKDEKVCAQCGPLHGMEVPIADPFTVGKLHFWAPPLHVNCRCENRLKAHLTSEVARQLFEHAKPKKRPKPESEDQVEKADWDPREHPRDSSSGRFARVNRGRLQPYQERDELDIGRLADEALLREATVQPEKPKLNLNLYGSATPTPTDQTSKPPLNLNITPVNTEGVAPPKLNLNIGPNLELRPDLNIQPNLNVKPNYRLKPITGIRDLRPPRDSRKLPKHQYYAPGNGQTLYAVYDEDEHELQPTSGQARPVVDLTNVQFTSDISELNALMSEMENRKIRDAFTRFKEQDVIPGLLTMRAPGPDPNIRVQLDDQALSDALDHYERGEPDDTVELQAIDISRPSTELSRWGLVRHEVTSLGPIRVKYSDIIENFRLDELSQALEPVLMEIDKVRDDTDVVYNNRADNTITAVVNDRYRFDGVDFGGFGNNPYRYKRMLLAPIEDDED